MITGMFLGWIYCKNQIKELGTKKNSLILRWNSNNIQISLNSSLNHNCEIKSFLDLICLLKYKLIKPKNEITYFTNFTKFINPFITLRKSPHEPLTTIHLGIIGWIEHFFKLRTPITNCAIGIAEYSPSNKVIKTFLSIEIIR